MNREDHKAIIKGLWFNKEEKRMKVSIQLDETSQPIEYTNVRNTYTKGDLFCVYVDKGEVHKFPVSSIFRIVEDFGWHGDGSIESSKTPCVGLNTTNGKLEKYYPKDTPNRGGSCTKPPIHENPSLDVAKKMYPKAEAGEYHGPDFPKSVTKDYPKMHPNNILQGDTCASGWPGGKIAPPHPSVEKEDISAWDAFESVEGDPRVESVTITTGRRMADNTTFVPDSDHADPAGILKN